MHFIEHLHEPRRLVLVWQAPDGPDRTRRVVGELLWRGSDIVFRYLTDTDDFARARDLGFDCHPAFRKTDREYSAGVMDAFMRRLPPRSRGDFGKFLSQWRLTPDLQPSDLALLAYTGAKLPTDGFSIGWPLDEVEPPCELLIEVAGFRYQHDVDVADLSEGMPVRFVPEPDNPKDPTAISVMVGGRRIGYVNRVQKNAVGGWLKFHNVEAFVERINGTAERPLVYLFCRVTQTASEQLPPAIVAG